MAASSAHHSMIYRVATFRRTRWLFRIDCCLSEKSSVQILPAMFPCCQRLIHFSAGMRLAPPPSDAVWVSVLLTEIVADYSQNSIGPSCAPTSLPPLIRTVPPTFRLIYFPNSSDNIRRAINLTACSSSLELHPQPTTRAITKQYWVATSQRFRIKVRHFFIFAVRVLTLDQRPIYFHVPASWLFFGVQWTGR